MVRSPADRQPPTGAGRGRWLALAAVGGALAMVFVDETAVGVALPSIRADLGLTVTQAHWVPNAYLLAFASCALIGGRAGDLVERRRLFGLGLLGFAAASVLCALAPSGALLIGARVLQGIGAAAMMPQTVAIIADVFAGDALDKAMGVYIGGASAFLIIGPLAGGALTDLVGWRAIFWVNPVLAAAILATAIPALPRTAPATPRGVLDVAGAVLLVAGLAGVVAAIMTSAEEGLGAPAVLVPLAGGIAALAALVAFERRARSPLIDISLLGRRVFGSAVVLLIAVQFAYIAVVVYGAVYVQDVLSLSPLAAGLAILPALVPTLALGPLNGIAMRALGARPLLLSAAGATALALAAIAFASAAERLWVFEVALLAWGVAIPFIYAPANSAGIEAAPAERRGTAGGMLETAPQVGATLGLAAVGAVIGARDGSPPVVADAFEAGFLVAAAAMAAAAALAALLLCRARGDPPGGNGAVERATRG